MAVLHIIICICIFQSFTKLSDRSIRFSLDKACNMGAPLLLSEQVKYTLRRPSSKCTATVFAIDSFEIFLFSCYQTQNESGMHGCRSSGGVDVENVFSVSDEIWFTKD